MTKRDDLPSADSLSLEEKVGQVLCFGWQGVSEGDSRSVNDHARALIEDFGVGSIAAWTKRRDARPDPYAG